jgi:hypothetical protein
VKLYVVERRDSYTKGRWEPGQYKVRLSRASGRRELKNTRGGSAKYRLGVYVREGTAK